VALQASDDINISLMKMPQGDPDSIATLAIRCLFDGEEVVLSDFDILNPSCDAQFWAKLNYMSGGSQRN